MNKNFFLTCFFVTIILGLPCAAATQPQQEYCKISSLGFLKNQLESLNDQALVVLDVDDTLIEGVACMEAEKYKQFCEIFSLLWKSQDSPKTQWQLQSKLNKVVLRLIENESPEIVQLLQKKGSKVITLTSMPKKLQTEDCFLSLVKSRSQVLQTLGFNFAASFPEHFCHLFTQLGNASDHPMFFEGNLFAEPCSKGIVLKAFLECLKWRPHKTIFIDNDKFNVLSVLETTRAMNLDCLGVIYQGVKNVQPLDLNLFKFRIEHLLKTDEWVSQEEADKLVHKAT